MSRRNFVARRKFLLEHYETACDLHNHVESQASLAVMKATLLLAAHTLLCAAYIQVAVSLKIFERVNGYPEDLFIISGTLMLAAFLASLRSIWPKLESTDDNRLLFFAGIGRIKDVREYVEDYKKLSKDSLTTMLLSNVHGKSDWLIQTFEWIRAATICSAAGTLFCVVAVWWLRSPIKQDHHHHHHPTGGYLTGREGNGYRCVIAE